MELHESVQVDQDSNRRGRPRSFEQARKQLLLAETVKTYVSCVPILLESGLHAIIFLNFYKYFRENGLPDVKAILDQFIIKPIESVGKWWFDNSPTHGLLIKSMYDMFFGKIEGEYQKTVKTRVVNQMDWEIFERLMRQYTTWSWNAWPPESPEDAAIQEQMKHQHMRDWFTQLPVIDKKNGSKTQDIILREYAKAVKEKAAAEDTLLRKTFMENYRMGALEAAAWAAALVLLFKAGTNLIGNLGGLAK